MREWIELLLKQWRLTGICIDEDAIVMIKYAVILFIVISLSGCISNQKDCTKRYEFFNNGTAVVCHRIEWMYGNIVGLYDCDDGQSYANPVNVKIIEKCV